MNFYAIYKILFFFGKIETIVKQTNLTTVWTFIVLSLKEM